MPGVMNGYRDDYGPYGRRDVYRDPQMADPYRRPPPDAYDRNEPHYSTSLPRDVRDEPRNGFSNGGPGFFPPPPSRDNNGYAPPGSNGYGPKDNGYPPRDNGYDRRPRGKEDDVREKEKPRRVSDQEDPNMYELDHLATFTVGQGVISPEDGIRKLRQMEASTGIWTMRAQLLVTPNEIIVFDKQTMEEIERFPLRLVSRPMAVTNQIRRDIYNNIVLFTVLEDNRRDSPAEMHIFQCTTRPAQDVVDDIIEAKEGKGKYANRQPPPPAPAPAPYQAPRRDSYREERERAAERSAAAAAAYQPGPKPSRELQKSMRRRDTDNESVLSEKTDKEVQLLNHCFDDIERFVGRLQQAAEAYKELDRRRKSKNKHDGMLSVRARPPPAQDFVDVFQKFKLSFILLARLKPHIHDPNAPELVHFLFTPLSLVVEASKDPRNSAPDLPSRVISPLLNADAIDLLRNCLNSKEMDLWYTLGEAWTVPKEQWRDQVPQFYPRFTDGWQPAPGVIEALNLDSRYRENLDHRSREIRDPMPSERYSQQSEPRRSYDDNRYGGREDPRDSRRYEDDDPYRGRPPPAREPPRERTDYYAQERQGPGPSQPNNDYYARDRNMDREREQERGPPAPRSAPQTSYRSMEDEQAAFRDKLLREGAKVFEVVTERSGKNAKELTVRKGEILECLDDSRNWYKLRNSKGEVGHAPYTIIEAVRK